MISGMSGHMDQGKSHDHVKLTPPAIIAALGGPESFDLDPAATPTAPKPWPTARTYYRGPRADDLDGLTEPWHDRVWLNPPFDNRRREGQGLSVVEKFSSRMAEHGRGIILVAARTETFYWQQFIWGAATTSAILFLTPRPHFYWPDGTRMANNSAVPIALAAYGEDDAAILGASELHGAFVTGWKRI